MSYVFIDTCVLIDVLNGKAKVDADANFVTNAIVEIEILQGVRDKKEQSKTIKFLRQFSSVGITSEIIELAKALVIKYALSNRLKLADAIIAATCLIYDLPLLTYNTKDFDYIEDLMLASDEI